MRGNGYVYSLLSRTKKCSEHSNEGVLHTMRLAHYRSVKMRSIHCIWPFNIWKCVLYSGSTIMPCVYYYGIMKSEGGLMNPNGNSEFSRGRGNCGSPCGSEEVEEVVQILPRFVSFPRPRFP